MAKKLLIDLDVITVAKWEKTDERRKEAEKLVERVKKGEFDVYVPYTIVELISKWKNRTLSDDILEFYSTYSKEIISTKKIVETAEKTGHDSIRITKHLMGIGVKEEDAILVITASLFDLDSLVTFNRKHLKNNTKKINEVLKKYGLKKVDIVFPSEI